MRAHRIPKGIVANKAQHVKFFYTCEKISQNHSANKKPFLAIKSNFQTEALTSNAAFTPNSTHASNPPPQL